MTKVKICGLCSYDNALMVAEAGADLIGLNFYDKSPRFIDVGRARELVKRLRGKLGGACPLIVGVFVNADADEVRRVAAYVGLDYAQLSGDESQRALRALDGVAFKAIRPRDVGDALAEAERFASVFPADSAAPSLLVDAYNPKLYGGTGERAAVDVALALRDVVPRLMLAGGLSPKNVAGRVRAIGPWGVDVASGVEDGRPGIKDEGKTRAFIAAVRSVEE